MGTMISAYSGQWDYYQYSYCGAIILIGFLVNLIVIGRSCYDRRRRTNRRSARYTINENSDGLYLPFTILTCFVASSNLLFIITRDLGHLLEASTGGDWRSTNFVCKIYKFSTFLSFHLCSYSVVVLLGCTLWYVCYRTRITPKQNRIGMIVAVCWASAIAFCSPFYHVAGLAEEEEQGVSNNPIKRNFCYTIRPRDDSKRSADLIFAYYPHFLIVTILIVPLAAIVVCFVIFGRKLIDQPRFVTDDAFSPVRFVRGKRQVGAGRDEIDEFANDNDQTANRARRGVILEEDEKSDGPKFSPKPAERRSKPIADHKEHQPLAHVHHEMTESTISGQTRVSVKWKTCRLAAVVSLTYLVCWLPYAVVYLMVARGNLDPNSVSITIPTYMLFLLYPIVSAVCLLF